MNKLPRYFLLKNVKIEQKFSTKFLLIVNNGFSSYIVIWHLKTNFEHAFTVFIQNLSKSSHVLFP